jgi:hypothetical protein
MDRHWAYCSACDRQVEVVIRPHERTESEAGGAPDDIICLEVGHTCTGALCPITDVPPDEMREALRRVRKDDAASLERSE